MRKISDTIQRLTSLRIQGAANGAPGGNRLETLKEFGSNPGALTAKFHHPQGLREHAPLVVVLHGCTQSAEAYNYHSGWSQLADELGFAVLYPEQNAANNPNLCFNWFLPADTRGDTGELQSIRQMIEAMIVSLRLDRTNIFITGLSAGGAMASAMLANYPEVFAGGALMAGLPYGVANSMPEAFESMRGQKLPGERDLQKLLPTASRPEHWPRISIWHGSGDHVVAPANAEAIAAQWRGVHGLGPAPTHTRTEGRLEKREWCDAGGAALIELNLIAGMSHGTPVGNDGLGMPGPFMLDVGVSSTRRIGVFWGLDQQIDGEDRPPLLPRATIGPAAEASSPASLPGSPWAGQAGMVQQQIENALRAAGLMK